jgi:putative transcriptional regulator
MKKSLFDELVASVREAGKILRGEAAPARSFEMDVPKVKAIRYGFRLTQSEFAAMLGISVQTLRNWEQGRRLPDGPARVLLQVAAKHPEAVWDAVRPFSREPARRKRRGKVA